MSEPGQPGVDMNREKLDRALPIIRGLFAGLAVVAIAAVFALVLMPGMARVTESRQDPSLRSWSTARILAELGEYETKIPDCAGLAPGMTAYAYPKFNLTGQVVRVVIVCK